MEASATPALVALRSALAHAAESALAARAAGQKVIGTRCLYAPEEIILAAGARPFPLFGTPEPVGIADSYFQPCTCEFARNLLDRALAGKLAFLDGLAVSNTCDAVRRLFDLWGAYVGAVPAYLINNPQKLGGEGNRAYFLEELRRFRSWVEKLTGARVSDAALGEAIALCDGTRRLQRELYALRREDPPRLGGGEALEACLAAALLPRAEANRLLGQLIAEVRARPAPDRSGPRLLLTGSVLDHPALIEMVEAQGGVVVADDLCSTMRTFWRDVGESGDPLEAIYRSLNARPWCACMHPMESRLEHLLGLVQEFRADAVLYFNLKYCHPFLYEAPIFKRALEARGVPTAVLEVGHDLSGHGQLGTRIQAFVEMVGM